MSLPTLPAWLQDLPRDSRGYPVPAEVGWRDGEPKLDSVDTMRKIALGFHRACAVCGFEIRAGSPAYRAFAQSDAAVIRGEQRERSLDPSGPLHASCVLFSAMACPYLRAKTARLGPDSQFEPGARRGTLAAVMGFADFGLLVYEPLPGVTDVSERHAPQFAYLQLVEDIPYRMGEELAQRFDAAVEQDQQAIDMSGRRWFWGGNRTEARDAEREAFAGMRAITTREPMYTMRLATTGYGSGQYVAFPL